MDSSKAIQVEQFSEQSYGESMGPNGQFQYEPMAHQNGPIAPEFNPPVPPFQQPQDFGPAMWMRSSAPAGDSMKAMNEESLGHDLQRSDKI